MATVRVYLPLTLARLRAARAAARFGPAPLVGQAVTDALAAALGDADAEEQEYAAMTSAAQAALALLGAEDPPLRLVAAVDAAAAVPGGTAEDPGRVTLPHEVPWRRLAALHVDGPEAAADVAAARDALRRGADDSDRLAERCLDHELGWYAAQEADELLARLSAG